MKKILLTITILLSIVIINAQNSKIDSLENLIQNYKQEDTSLVNMLNEVSFLYYSTELEKTLEYAEKAKTISEKIEYEKGKAESLRFIGIYYHLSGDYNQAIKYYEDALELNLEIGHKKNIASCYNNMGILFRQQSNYPKALEYYQKSLKIAEELNNKQSIANCLNNISIILVLQKDYETALEYLERNQKSYQELGNEDGVAMCYLNTGVVHAKLNDYNKAIEFYDKSLKIYEGMGDKTGLAMCLQNSGDSYKELGEYSKALEIYKKALSIKEELGNKQSICYTYIGLTDVFIYEKDYEKAMEYAQKSLDIANELKLYDELKVIHKQFSDIYVQKNNYKLAYENFVLHKQYNDSVFNENNIKKIAELETQYDYEKEKQAIELEQQKKDAIQQAEAKRQKTIRNSFIFGFILMLILVFVVLNSLIQKRKANKILTAQKNEIQEKNEELRQQKEEILAQAEELEATNFELEKLSIVAQETDNAVLIFDEKYNLEWTNQAFEKIYGYNLDELSLKDKINLLNDSNNSNIKNILDECLKDKKSKTYKNENRKKNGETLWVQTTLTPIFEFGTVKKIIAIEADITEIQKANIIIEKANREISSKNRQITESISCARTIQQAILPIEQNMSKTFDNFVIFRPKDVVSGDFYWFAQEKDISFVAAIDCTGHGVPGAFMSMIGYSLLNDIVKQRKIFSPKDIFTHLNEEVIKSLKQDITDNQDGMDGGICLIKNTNEKNFEIEYCGAKRPLFYIKNGEEIEKLKGDRKSIGGISRSLNVVNFTNQKITLQKNDLIYLSSDGYTDQNNAERRRLGSNRLISILNQINTKELTEQKQTLENELDNWQGEEKQRDDITLIGIKF